MRKKVSLYIADKLVDLDDQSFILFNHTMEETSNPTIVKNSFSQQITLKESYNNNLIFGHSFRFDRKTTYGVSMTGGFFDPQRKMPFALFDDMGNLLEEGYAKLDNISRSKWGIEYKVSLYGGLGSFFYSLMYNADGSKSNLAVMRYLDFSGEANRSIGMMPMSGGYSAVQDCWSWLKDPDTYEAGWSPEQCGWCSIINFAPAYNGLPDKFSADKAVCNRPFDNVPNFKRIKKDTSEGSTTTVEYSFKTGTKSNLMVMSKPHTEWEMKDLRWYLQRPVIRVKAIIDAICDPYNNGGFEVVLSPFFSESNSYYQKAWITLPMIAAEDRYANDAIYKLVKATKSPAEYLISFAKMFGLVFLYNKGLKRVSIMHRSEFYKGEEVIDLTDKIDASAIQISPVVGQSHFYQFGEKAIGEWAAQYKEDYGEDYGIQKVNTGNAFNMNTEILTKDIVFKDAVEVVERNLLFTSNYLSRDSGGGSVELFILPKYEGVKLQLWGIAPGESVQSMEEIDVLTQYEYNLYYDNSKYPLSDWLPKVQLHEKDNKAIDGADVLLMFNGIKQTPTYGTRAVLQYRLTDDTDDMLTLNENTPCWNFSNEYSTKIDFLPSFRRAEVVKGEDVESIEASFEWGIPKERGVQDLYDGQYPKVIYDQWWKRYLTDRYDADTYTMTCKVNLRDLGISIGQDLLRRFFFYQDAIFVLNKIVNHSITTLDDTECEFIRVQDISNYIEL